MKFNKVVAGELEVNCWIVSLSENDECFLVDPGGDADLILDELEKLGLTPRYIVITHAHFDHVAALADIASAYPRAGIAVHSAEKSKLGPGSLELHRRDFAVSGASAYVDALWKPLPKAKILLEEGSTIGPFTVLHLPGHSPGSIALYSEQERALISGDTLFRAGVGRTDLPGGNWEQLNLSILRLFEMDGSVTVYPGHGETTTIAAERER